MHGVHLVGRVRGKLLQTARDALDRHAAFPGNLGRAHGLALLEFHGFGKRGKAALEVMEGLSEGLQIGGQALEEARFFARLPGFVLGVGARRLGGRQCLPEFAEFARQRLLGGVRLRLFFCHAEHEGSP